VNATITGDTVMGATGMVGFSVYGDPANGLGALTVPVTVLPPASLSPLAENASGPLSLAAPFSLTEYAQVSAGGATVVNLDASFNFTAVPEPGVSALGALACGGWVLFRVRNRRA
jgi:hypothetical protein